MSVEKKVSFLVLLLVALIIGCVYKHTNGLGFEKPAVEVSSKENKTEIKSDEQKDISIDSKSVQTNTDENVQPIVEEIEEPNVDQDVEQIVPTKNNEDSSIVTNEQKVEDIATSEENLQENVNELDKKTKVEEKEQPIVEEKKIVEIKEDDPLLTTLAGYKRVGTEKKIEELSRQTQLLQIRINDYIKQHPIIFKRGSNVLIKKSLRYVNTVIDILKENSNIKIEVAGHTDAAGEASLNKQVSIERAVAVKELLIKAGINKDRIKARGYGENIPLVPNSPGGYSKINRRVEFNIVEE
jgi:OmpA-OmpF porin, OOP family